MNWPELVSGLVAGTVIAVISILKSKKNSSDKKEWGYNPYCINCPLFQAALKKVPDNDKA